jgi:hypothetical protein
MKGPDSGFGLGHESLNRLEAGEALEPVGGVGGMPVITSSDLVLGPGTGRVIGAAR